MSSSLVGSAATIACDSCGRQYRGRDYFLLLSLDCVQKTNILKPDDMGPCHVAWAHLGPC